MKDFSEKCPTCGQHITLAMMVKDLKRKGFKSLAKLLETTHKYGRY